MAGTLMVGPSGPIVDRKERNMNRRFRNTLRAFALVLGTLVPGALSAQTTITVLHVGDSHSHLDGLGPRDAALKDTQGGIARVATIVGGIRATEPNTLFLHAGDAFQGDLFFNAFFGIPELTILNQLGLDAMTVGNHEFDFGPGVLALALSQSGDTPLLATNLDFSDCAPRPALTCPRASSRTASRRSVASPSASSA